MRTAFFVLSLLLLGLLAGETPLQAATGLQPEGEADFLCETAAKGTVPLLPAPFSRWMIVVCPKQGQALVPVEGYVWTMLGTLSPISIMAQPPGTHMPPQESGFGAIRFKSFAGTKLAGQNKENALKRLGLALQDMRAIKLDAVLRLQATSNIYDAASTIYLYIKDGSPKYILVCVDNCRRMMALNVLKLGRGPSIFKDPR
jgi:hypothetical protein